MKKIRLSTTHIIMLSFALVILVGTLLLMLPVSSADGSSASFEDALFTATTSTCVTGLVVLPTATAWSTFGHIVILLMIQIGGLGLITVMAGFVLFFHRKIGLSDRILLQDAFNLSNLAGLSAFVKKVIIGTLCVEAVGALLYMTVFVPQFGARGIWISVFNSVSAFCNAGIDIIGENSLCDYVVDPVINAVTSLLVIISGIGYIVWWDVIRVTKKVKKQGLRAYKSLTLHSKIALCTTFIFLALGTIFIFAFEYDNPATIGKYSTPQKLLASFFQSVTTRTAGFAGIPQENLTDPTAMICLFLMFVGGSPVGTAGGIKTVTVAVLFATVISSVRNRNEVTLFGRNIPKEACTKAISVTCVSFAIMSISSLLLSAFSGGALMDVLYETVSATATVGLSRNFTSTFDTACKFIITANMYLGRVGPISLAIAFKFKSKNTNIIKNPMEDISVG